MSSVAIHSSISHPGVFMPHPATTCIQWTAEGQLLFMSKNAVYIYTPVTGIGIDTSSAVKSSPKKLNTVPQPLPWLKTVIEQDKRSLYHHWPSNSQEWGAVTLGSLDISLRAITASPSLLASNKLYVVAVLTSNLQLSLWVPLKDHLRGQWVLLHDCTPLLKNLAETATNSAVHQVLHAQIGCCSWSFQPVFSDPAPLYDGSVLALGSRAGTVILLRLHDTDEVFSLEHIVTLHISNGWLTHLAWTEWNVVGPQQVCSTLACGQADGSISLVEITQTMHTEPATQSGHIYRIEVLARISDVIHAADNKTITGLEWVLLPTRGAVLVHFRPGLVHLWARQHAQEAWSGSLVFPLQTQKTSVSSSSLHSVSGVSYVEKHDMLVFSLQDGSFYTIYQMSSYPTLESPNPELPTSATISLLSRRVFSQCEEKPVRQVDLNVVDGMTSFNGSQTFVWSCESLCLTDFSYKADAQRTTNIITADLWDENDPELFETHIRQVIALPLSSNIFGRAPLAVLRPILFALYHGGQSPSLFTRLLEILESPIPMVLPETHPAASVVTLNVRQAMRDSLAKHLLGSQRTCALRLRLALADFCWRHAPDEELEKRSASIASTLLSTVSHNILQVLVNHLLAVSNLTTQEDISFVYRVVIKCILPGSPPTLLESAQLLANRAKELGQKHSSGQQNNNLEENCPACNVAVPYNDISNATCSNGHTWPRCSITTFILSTPMVRTCVGCTRKAFLPPIQRRSPDQDGEAHFGSASEADVSHLPLVARSWVVQELLRAACRCLFCGNSFVTLL